MDKIRRVVTVWACCVAWTVSLGRHVAQAQAPVSPAAALGQPIAQIVTAARDDRGVWALLAELCDDIGHRLSGSAALEQAVAWAVARLQAAGLDNVRAEPVEVPKWVRGREAAEMVAPRPLPLQMLGLGNSVGTPPAGVTAEVVVAVDEASLDALGERVRGRIVLFDNPMPPWTPSHGARYGEAVRFRSRGPQLAAQRGAVAVLVRSVTAHSLATPHTGATSRDVPTVPAAAVSVEHAQLLHRLLERGQRVVVRLQMQAHFEGTAPSANVVAELRGRERPDEVVVLGGHLDSWDVGQGAHDDGAGCVQAMQTLILLKRLGLQPRRTLRVVLWTNEENGLAGAKAYASRHAATLPQHVAAIEADSGGFRPVALGVALRDPQAERKAQAQLRELLAPLAAMQIALDVPLRTGGADVGVLEGEGVPTLGLQTHGATYFDYHHTDADTLDKVDPAELREGLAAMAGAAWLLANWPGVLGR